MNNRWMGKVDVQSGKGVSTIDLLSSEAQHRIDECDGGFERILPAWHHPKNSKKRNHQQCQLLSRVNQSIVDSPRAVRLVLCRAGGAVLAHAPRCSRKRRTQAAQGTLSVKMSDQVA